MSLAALHFGTLNGKVCHSTFFFLQSPGDHADGVATAATVCRCLPYCLLQDVCVRTALQQCCDDSSVPVTNGRVKNCIGPVVATQISDVRLCGKELAHCAHVRVATGPVQRSVPRIALAVAQIGRHFKPITLAESRCEWQSGERHAWRLAP